MKCYRCSAEIPGQAQFCMKCGTPVAAGPPGGVTMARSAGMTAPAKKKPLAAIIAAILVLLALASFLAWKFMNPTGRAARTGPGSQVVDRAGLAGTGGPLLDKSARIGPSGPLTDAGAIKSGPAPSPVDVIDYLKFLKEIERSKRII